MRRVLWIFVSSLLSFVLISTQTEIQANQMPGIPGGENLPETVEKPKGAIVKKDLKKNAASSAKKKTKAKKIKK